MNFSQLVGRAIVLELDEYPPLGEHAGSIVAACEPSEDTQNEYAILIRLNDPFCKEELSCEYLVAIARQYGAGGQSILRLSPHFFTQCAIYRVPPEQALSNSPCDISWWRGGFAALACVKIAD